MSMSWLVTNILASFLLPPLNCLLVAALGCLMWRRRPRLARALVTVGLLTLTALSLPVTARALMGLLETRYAVLQIQDAPQIQADAIVILAGGRYRQAPEYGGKDDVRQSTLERLRYGAWLARKTGKPILVTGGSPDSEDVSEAQAMQEALARDFGLRASWVEGRSENTRENARFSAEILRPIGIRRVALVTHAYHMPRAVAAFEAAGFDVLPAPMGFFMTGSTSSPLSFMPESEAMHNSSRALHELIGKVWYRWRG